MRTLLLSLLLVLSTAVSASPYFVVSIKGDVFQGDQPLEPRDQLEETTELRFVGKNAQVYVMSPRQGYFVLGPGEQSSSDKSEFLLAVRQALLPASEWKMTGIREITNDEQGVHLEDTYDMLDFFRGRIAIVGSLEVHFSADYFSFGSDFKAWEDGHIELQVHNPEDARVEIYGFLTQSWNLAALLEMADPGASFVVRYLPEYDEDELLEAEHFQIVEVDAAQLNEELRYLHELTPEEDRPLFESQLAVEFVTSRYGKMHPHTLSSMLEEALADKEE